MKNAYVHTGMLQSAKYIQHKLLEENILNKAFNTYRVSKVLSLCNCVESESYYKGTILQRDYRKMAISGLTHTLRISSMFGMMLYVGGKFDSESS